MSNAFNLIDGLAGLAAGIGLFSTTTLFLAASLNERWEIFMLSAALAGALLGFDDDKAKVFAIAIHTGAILAVIIVYWQKIRDTVLALPTQKPAQRLALNALFAFLRGTP